jgi:AraC-like DNA-binding protein
MEAKRNLVYTNMTVNDVAYDLGYKDPAYFSRFFSTHVGEAPGRFKTRYRRNRDELSMR